MAVYILYVNQSILLYQWKVEMVRREEMKSKIEGGGGGGGGVRVFVSAP